LQGNHAPIDVDLVEEVISGNSSFKALQQSSFGRRLWLSVIANSFRYAWSFRLDII